MMFLFSLFVSAALGSAETSALDACTQKSIGKVVTKSNIGTLTCDEFGKYGKCFDDNPPEGPGTVKFKESCNDMSDLVTKLKQANCEAVKTLCGAGCKPPMTEYKKDQKKVCANACEENDPATSKGTCDASYKCVSSTDDEAYTQEVATEVRSGPGTFCKLELPRCAKSEAADAQCATKTDTCVKVTDGATACDVKQETKSNDCYCKKAKAAADTGLSGGAIAGIVIGSIVGVAALAVGGYFLYKHLSKRKPKKAGKANAKKPKRA